MGKSSINGPCSMAMLNNKRVNPLVQANFLAKIDILVYIYYLLTHPHTYTHTHIYIY